MISLQVYILSFYFTFIFIYELHILWSSLWSRMDEYLWSRCDLFFLFESHYFPLTCITFYCI